MKWIVHLTVVLLNVLWVAFFLTDPLAVFVQKRSFMDSDEEMKVGEFCLQPPSDPMWTSGPGPADVSTDETRTTSDANRERMNKPNESHSVSRTSTEPNQLNSSQQSDIRAQPPSTSSTVRDLNEATTFTPTVQTSTSVISSSTTEVVPVARRRMQNRQNIRACCVQVSRTRIRLSEIIAYHVQRARPPCVRAVILTLKSGQHFCADPRGPWIRQAVMFISLIPKIQESFQSDRCASTVRDSNETTTAAVPLQTWTSSQLISNNTSEAAAVTANKSSETPVTQRKIEEKWNSFRCPCVAFAKTASLSQIKEYQYCNATSWCPQNALILISKSGEEICLDPDVGLGQMIMERIDSRSKTEEASESDRRASTVRDLTETTTAAVPLQTSTSSQLISSSTPEAAAVTANESSETPVTQRNKQDQPHND